MKPFEPGKIELTKYLFFTGKGGVGKTSCACAAAVTLADTGKKVLLISTDPASNLQDVFSRELSNKGTPIEEIPGLCVANLDPIRAAAEYRESVVAPYRGKLPDTVIQNMEEQLSGSCTVEIAAFNEFSHFITDKKAQSEYDYIIFDTAPTGHTLRMLQLPSAWSNFISESTHGASCLGQLSGLEEKKDIYKTAVETLADEALTTLLIVARPEDTPLKEAARASSELSELGVNNQMLIINGMLLEYDDPISKSLYQKQRNAVEQMPEQLKQQETSFVPLRAYNITGLDNVRSFLVEDHLIMSSEELITEDMPELTEIVDDIERKNRKVIFTMGKGGVGKTSIAAAIAVSLSHRGKKVHLATTDPAAHLHFVIQSDENLSISHIDEAAELKRYQEEILSKARETMSENDLAYIEEDLRSPCTQEIAVFRAFAEIVEKADNEVVVIDTAPTGHTLLLLDSTQSYHKEVKRTQGDVPESVQKLLPRLRSEETEVIIVTLPETTPVYEALRLESDLERAGLASHWWIINSSLYRTNTENELLKARAGNEIRWINEVDRHTAGYYAVIPWTAEEITGEKILEIQGRLGIG